VCSASHAVIFEKVIEEDFNGTGPFGIGIDSDIESGLDNPGWVIDFIPDPDTGANLSTVELNATNQTLEVRAINPLASNVGVANFARVEKGGVDPNGAGVQAEHFTVFENVELLFASGAGRPILTYDTGNSGFDGITISITENDDGSDGVWPTVFLDSGFQTMNVPEVTSGVNIALGVQEFADGSVNLLYDEDTTDNGGVPEKKIHHTYNRFNNFISPIDRSVAYSIIPNTNGMGNEVNYDIVSTRIVFQSEATDGDFDLDGDVDGNDVLRWQRGHGAMGTGTFQNGDANVDGNIDDLDLAIWEENYGFVPPSETRSAAGSVPEPTSALLALSALALALLRPRS
ncbi:hypothetical protein OAS39_12760, partial [Pirellulales bacterium]|nr:hypothetical protein [Pirellulales bacterium]